MPKYWGKQIFSLGSFPEVGQKLKTEKERLNNGNNNGQATHGARKHAWRMHGARKPPGPKHFFGGWWQTGGNGGKN